MKRNVPKLFELFLFDKKKEKKKNQNDKSRDTRFPFGKVEPYLTLIPIATFSALSHKFGLYVCVCVERGGESKTLIN